MEQQSADAQPSPCQTDRMQPEDSRSGASSIAVKVPKLLKTYLAIGARIAAPPAWDREFRTIDFLTLLDLKSAFGCGAQPLSGSADAMTLRRFRRAVALAFVLALCVVRYWLARLRGPMTLERRALWLQAIGARDSEMRWASDRRWKGSRRRAGWWFRTT